MNVADEYYVDKFINTFMILTRKYISIVFKFCLFVHSKLSNSCVISQLNQCVIKKVWEVFDSHQQRRHCLVTIKITWYDIDNIVIISLLCIIAQWIDSSVGHDMPITISVKFPLFLLVRGEFLFCISILRKLFIDFHLIISMFHPRLFFFLSLSIHFNKLTIPRNVKFLLLMGFRQFVYLIKTHNIGFLR